MGLSFGRALRVVGVLCLMGASMAVGRTAGADEVAEAKMLVVARGNLPTYAYAPAVTAAVDGVNGASDARPLTIYLHGICGNPGNGCPFFRDGATSASWLLCPSAPTECEGGGATWAGSTTAQAAAVAGAEQKITALYPQAVDAKRPRVLIGFSQGSYAARNLIKAQPGKFRAALFIGADIETTADEFRKAGIARVAFAAGRYDMMRKPLEKEAATLKAAGFPTRFVDLGAVGHTYAPAQNADEFRKAGIARVAFAAGRYDMMRKPLEKEAATLKAAGFPTRFVDLGAVGHTYAPAQNADDLRDAIAWLEATP